MFESFRDWDLKDTGSCDELGAGAPAVRSKGTTRESLIEGAKQKHTQREGLYDLRIRCRGVGQGGSSRALEFGGVFLLELKMHSTLYKLYFNLFELGIYVAYPWELSF